MDRPTKRPRVGSESVVIPPGAVMRAKENVYQLEPETIQQLLLDAIPNNPQLIAAVNRAHDAMIRQREAQVLDFDSYSKSAWRSLNTGYSRGSDEMDAAYEAANEIGEMFSEMLEEAKAEHASYGTRRNAAVTMRKILKSALLSDGTMGRYVRQSCYGWDDTFVELITEAFEEGEELEKLASDVEKGQTFLDKVCEVANLAKEYCVLGRLSEAVELLENPYQNFDEAPGPDWEAHQCSEVDGSEEEEDEDADEDAGDSEVEVVEVRTVNPLQAPAPPMIAQLLYSKPPSLAQLLN